MTLQWGGGGYPQRGQRNPLIDQPFTPESGWYGPGGTGEPGQPQPPAQSPYLDFLNTDEEGLRMQFFGGLGGLNAGQQRFGQTLFQPTFNRYLGQLGQMAVSGQAPNLNFSDFLKNDFNLNRELLRQPQTSSRLFGRPQFFFGR